MDSVYSLSRIADIFCNTVDAVVATCNEMAAITCSVSYIWNPVIWQIEERDKHFVSLHKSNFVLKEEIAEFSGENREESIRYMNRCIDECMPSKLYWV